MLVPSMVEIRDKEAKFISIYWYNSESAGFEHVGTLEFCHLNYTLSLIYYIVVPTALYI